MTTFNNTSNNNFDTLSVDLEKFNQITGALRAAESEEMAKGANRAVWALTYLDEYSNLGLGDFVMNFGTTVSNSGRLLTENRLGLEATKMLLSFECGKFVSWRVGKPSEGKSVNLLPSRKGWMHVLMQNDEVVRVRPATASDFANAPAFEVSSPAVATKLWHKVGELTLDWTARFERGEELTASLPARPSATSSQKNRTKPASKGQTRKPHGNRNRQQAAKA